MKKVKAILSDVDGTLSDFESYVLPGVKPMIKKIQGKGVRFSLATGRPYYGSVKMIEKNLGIKGIHILQNGATIFDSINNKILIQHAISKESTEKIIKYLLDQKIIFSAEANGNVYISKIFKENSFYPEITNKSLDEFDHNGGILKMVIYARANGLNEAGADFHKKNLQKMCSDISIHHFKMFDFYGSDINSEKATKHTGVLEYLKILNLSSDEVVAIGDGYNDYPLFTACGFGIAMANAPKELKEISDLIVPLVKDGGMVEALKYIDVNLT